MLNIFTLTWNGCARLNKLKESLIPALENIEYTWFIKDNNSDDNTFEVASKWGDKIKIVKYKDNLQNFAEGMNYLFKMASPNDNDDILLLNNDIVFGDIISLQKMLELLKKDNVGVVGARLLYTGTNKLQHAGVIFPHFGLPIHYRLGDTSDGNALKNRIFQVVTGAVILLKAKDYKNICTTNKSGISGMCDGLVWCFDDIDACLSIGNNTKKKIVYCGGTTIFHEESASLKENPVNKLFMKHNVNYFRNKWSGRYTLDLEKYKDNPDYNLYK